MPKDDLILEAQVNTLNEKVTQMHYAINIIQEQTKQVRFFFFFMFSYSVLLNR
jgi:hypothetical protein